jgi:TRAP-type uncharacterized transport system fused permease subunit
MTAATLLPEDQKLQELEEKFDPEMRFRPTMPPATQIVKWLLIALSAFHYYTAGFGLLQEITHRGVHLAFVLGMIFLVFAFSPSSAERSIKSSLLNSRRRAAGRLALSRRMCFECSVHSLCL